METSAGSPLRHSALHRFNMLMTDHHLADRTTGLELLERVAQTDPRAFRVLVSAERSTEVDAAIECGLVHAFCAKPFGLDELRRLLALVASRDERL